MAWIISGLIALLITLGQNQAYLKKLFEEKITFFVICCSMVIMLGPISILMCLFDFIFPLEDLEE